MATTTTAIEVGAATVEGRGTLPIMYDPAEHEHFFNFGTQLVSSESYDLTHAKAIEMLNTLAPSVPVWERVSVIVGHLEPEIPDQFFTRQTMGWPLAAFYEAEVAKLGARWMIRPHGRSERNSAALPLGSRAEKLPLVVHQGQGYVQYIYPYDRDTHNEMARHFSLFRGLAEYAEKAVKALHDGRVAQDKTQINWRELATAAEAIRELLVKLY